MSDLLSLADMSEAAKQAMQEHGNRLAAMTRAHIIERANEVLHTRRSLFIEGLTTFQLDEQTWVISLDASVRWIDEGMCVVYGKADKHIPAVLTPDGWVKIIDVKVGMLVLNQSGKWTQVLKIHDNDLFDYCVEYIDEEATAALGISPKKFDHHHGTGKRSKKKVVARCPSCSSTRITTRFALTDGNGISHCKKCIEKKPLISIELWKQRFCKRLVLTADHLVLTEKGWTPAQELAPNDNIFVPAWGACENCKKKVAFGGKWCNGSCFQSAYQRKLIAEGKHVSQDPEWKSRYYQNLGKKKVSGIEDVVAKIFTEGGFSTGFYSKEGCGAEWIRQYPVPSSIDKIGRQKYYYIDFYNPRLKLALEVDGHFHFTSTGLDRDKRRDEVLKSHGMQVCRVPVASIKNGEFKKSILPALLANHEGEIELIPARIGRLAKIIPSEFTPFSRRWDITVAEGSSFVCQGIVIHNSEHNMLESLLRSKKAKRAKDGSTYVVVPFEHGPGKGATNSTPAQATLLQTIKAELKRRDIPYAKIEKDQSGNAKVGRLHSFSITDAPIKTANGPGQGKGPVGAVMQGPGRLSHGGTRMTGVPLLSGISIYQKKVMGQDGKEKVKRSIMTFRVASSKHHEEGGRWEHPGLPATNLMSEAAEWATKTFERDIAPQIMTKFLATLS